MGERLEAFRAQSERNEEYHQKMIQESAREAQELKDFENDIISRRERIKENAKAYDNFKVGVRDMLLSEALSNITLEGIGENISDNCKFVVENLVNNFVKENGGGSIFLNIPKTYTLERVKNLVNRYTNIITEKADKDNKETFKVDKEDKIKFLDELNDEEDIENVKQAIALRVSNAEEEFITASIDDKMDIDNIIQDTTERINSIKSDMTVDDATRDGIEQEAVNLSKQKMDFIRENKNRSIFTQMVRNLSESIIKDESLRNEYSTDQGKIDMGRIVESAKCFYGFLETINTIKLQKVNEEYIQKVLDEMK